MILGVGNPENHILYVRVYGPSGYTGMTTMYYRLFGRTESGYILGSHYKGH